VAAFGRLVVPIACFALAQLVIGPVRLRESLWSVARWGASRGSVALGLLVGLGVAAGLLALAGVATCLGFAYAAAPHFGADVLTSSPLVALGAAVYVALFAAGSTFGDKGGGRWIGLGGDFVLGAGSGALSVVWPRSHLANLLGAEPPLGMTPSGSSLALLSILVAGTLVACLRSRG
jgi:hypothetical protein